MQTAGAETNVPLVVATVFAATFLVVGAIAYLILFRRSPTSAKPPAALRPAVPPAPVVDAAVDDQAADSTQITLPLDERGSPPPRASVLASAEPAVPATPTGAADVPPDGSRRLFVSLYRALMFATGLAGLLASALMFSAVEGVSILPVIALAVAAFSVYSIYRGFVLDPELRQSSRR